MKDVPSIERPVAEKLFRFWDAVPHSCAAIYQLIFDACAKASLSAPLEAFQHTMRLFEEQPGILSEENMPHPGYVYRPSEQRVFEKCPICGGAGTPYYRALSYSMSDFSYSDLPVKLWMKCGECGDLYTWKFPEGYLTREIRSEMIEPDPEHYLTALGQTSGGSLAAWCAVLNRLNKYTNGANLLEVGIGSGELLSVALEMGYCVEAVEISLEVAKKVSDILNMPIWVGDFLNYTSEKTYSIITMGDVLEHIAEPARALSIAHRLLADDGVLWLSTPNYESSFSKMRKFADPMWMEPHHISYFSYRGLKALARRCGFTIREYNVSNRYNGSMELVLTKQRP